MEGAGKKNFVIYIIVKVQGCCMSLCGSLNLYNIYKLTMLVMKLQKILQQRINTK